MKRQTDPYGKVCFQTEILSNLYKYIFFVYSFVYFKDQFQLPFHFQYLSVFIIFKISLIWPPRYYHDDFIALQCSRQGNQFSFSSRLRRSLSLFGRLNKTASQVGKSCLFKTFHEYVSDYYQEHWQCFIVNTVHINLQEIIILLL